MVFKKMFAKENRKLKKISILRLPKKYKSSSKTVCFFMIGPIENNLSDRIFMFSIHTTINYKAIKLKSLP